MKVIKRDGTTCDFDGSKIAVAIGKANESVDFEDRITDEQITAIVDDISSRHRARLLVEDIQDIIEQKILPADWRNTGPAEDIPCEVAS